MSGSLPGFGARAWRQGPPQGVGGRLDASGSALGSSLVEAPAASAASGGETLAPRQVNVVSSYSIYVGA